MENKNDPQQSEELTLEKLTLTHDGYFIEAFGAKRFAIAFLKKVLPRITIDCLELKRLTVDDRNLTDDLFKKAIADVVYRVPIKNTKKYANFFVIVEHKSYQDELTIFQLWCYLFLVCRREFQAAQDRGEVKVGYRLPPIIVIILHHGKSEFKGATELSNMFVSIPGLDGYYPGLQAVLFDLNTIEDDDSILNDPEVPELKVVLMVMKLVFRKDVAVKLKNILLELKPYSDDPVTRRIIRTTWVYLMNNARYMKRNYKAMMEVFENVTKEKAMPTMVEIWKAEGLALGKAEGIALGKTEGKTEGKAEGVARAILRVLTRNFGIVPESIVERVRVVKDIDKLDELFDIACDCVSLEEFEKSVR